MAFVQRPKKLQPNDATENANQREAGLAEVLALLEASRAQQGVEVLMGLIRGLGTLLEADTTFITRGLGSPTTRARGIAAWKDGKPKATWEYDLAGNPCQLTYSCKPTFNPCDVERLSAKKRGTGYGSLACLCLMKRARSLAISPFAPANHATSRITPKPSCGYSPPARRLSCSVFWSRTP